MTSRDRRIGLALATPLGVALLFSWVRVVGEGCDIVDDAAYEDAVARIGAVGDDDAIAVLPPWSVRPLQHLRPVASQVISSDGPWFALADARYRHVTVVVEPDADPWLAQLPAPATTTTSSRLQLFRFDGHGPAKTDFRARFDDAAHVRVEGSARRAWALVTENGADVILCGHGCVVSYDDVVLDDELVVAAGHTRDGADAGEQKHEGPVTLTVRVDDVVVATLVRKPSFVVEESRAALRSVFVNDVGDASDGEGFRVTVVDTVRFKEGAHVVSFAVDGDDGVSDRDFAFDAVTR